MHEQTNFHQKNKDNKKPRFVNGEGESFSVFRNGNKRLFAFLAVFTECHSSGALIFVGLSGFPDDTGC